jgi:hypothetical protein
LPVDLVVHGEAAEELLLPLEQALRRAEQQRLALFARTDEE